MADEEHVPPAEHNKLTESLGCGTTPVRLLSLLPAAALWQLAQETASQKTLLKFTRQNPNSERMIKSHLASGTSLTSSILFTVHLFKT